MARELRIIYYVEPDAAALARRAAQYFVEMADEAVEARGRARIAISGGSTPKAAFELLGDPGQPGAGACRGTSWISTGWTSAACRPMTRKATTA